MIQRTLGLLACLLLIACGQEKTLQSANIQTGQLVSLTDIDGKVPLVLQFENPPTSTQGTDLDQTINVTFVGTIDITQSNSPAAYSAIQGRETVELELKFINRDREEKNFAITPITISGQNPEPLKKPLVRQTIPFPLEDIAKIVFVVDKLEVAFFPRTQ